MKGTNLIRIDRESYKTLSEYKRKFKARSFSETIRTWEREMSKKEEYEESKFDKLFKRI